MSADPPRDEPLKDCSDLFDGPISEESAREMESLLSEGKVDGDAFADEIRVHAALTWRGLAVRAFSADELVMSDEREVPTCTLRGDQHKARLAWKTALLSSAATLLAVLFGGAVWEQILHVFPSGRLASIVESAGPEWADRGGARVTGDTLSKGKYDLVAGLVEVEFNSGARIILEAPAEFELINDSRMKLTRGNLVGKVPPEAIGFAVETPTTTVIDLGTEFGVGTRLGETLVEVFEGLVELDRTAQIGFSQDERPQLRTGEAARIQVDVAGIEMVDAGRILFTRKVHNAVPKSRFRITNDYVDAVKSSDPVAYWRFEELRDGAYPNEVSPNFPLVDAGRLPVRLVNNGGDKSASNYAADFFGGTWLKTAEHITAFDETAFSIELWVCPHRFAHQELIWLDPEMPGGKDFDVASVSLLRGEEWQGPTRRVRFSHSHPDADRSLRSIYSAGPYAIHAWQHIVAVKDGDQQLLYVNGNLTARAEATDESNLPFRVVLGRLPSPRPGGPRYLTGLIDEVAIYPHPLQIDEIQLHYRLAAFPSILTAQALPAPAVH